MRSFPLKTKVAVKMEALVRHEEKLELHERMSTRMVKSASVLDEGEFIGWDLRVPKKGLAQMTLFGSQTLCQSDLEWILEHSAENKQVKTDKASVDLKNIELYELVIPVMDGHAHTSIGFGENDIAKHNDDASRWPLCYSNQFAEMIKAFRNTGAEFRAVIGGASEDERRQCKKDVCQTWDNRGDMDDYIGRPVRARFLLLLPDVPTVRMLTVLDEAIHGIRPVYLGKIIENNNMALWENPLANARVFPDYAARILIMEPMVEENMVGVEVCEEKVMPIPASHKDIKSDRAVKIGRATATSGKKRTISIGEYDMRRHYQIIGQTGTGKSTLLSSIILNAMEQGYGLTFFDPHGSTIDTVLQCIPEKQMHKVRVVRIGDADHPVPLNFWDSGDFEKEERNISDLCELFSDIFDPHLEGVVGPRYERWLSTFCKASLAFLGRRASFESIAVLSQSQSNMYKLYDAIKDRYPELAETIKEEYGTDKSSDFHQTLNWYLCKFQRLTSVEQLRKTLGAGTNALDFRNTIDSDAVTLIDLASPTIGTHAARIVGTLTLMKLWNAAMKRRERSKTHIVMVDEASLFQTNPMPRMLAESRKFGLSMVLCHQHMGQLTWEVREALEANSANFSAFRLSPRDAANAAVRFDDPKFATKLTRLDAYNAMTTISVDGRQSAPFTLETVRPKKQKDGEYIASEIELNSIEQLVWPYEPLKALTPAEILDLLNHPEKLKQQTGTMHRVDDKTKSKPDWLYEWEKRRKSLKQAS